MGLDALCSAFNEPGAPYQAIPYVRGIDVRVASQTSVKSRQPIDGTLRNLGPARMPKGRRHGAVTSLKVLIAKIFRFHPRACAGSLALSAGHDLTMVGVRAGQVVTHLSGPHFLVPNIRGTCQYLEPEKNAVVVGPGLAQFPFTSEFRQTSCHHSTLGWPNIQKLNPAPKLSAG